MLVSEQPVNMEQAVWRRFLPRIPPGGTHSPSPSPGFPWSERPRRDGEERTAAVTVAAMEKYLGEEEELRLTLPAGSDKAAENDNNNVD